MGDRVQKALTLFESGYSCCQSVIGAFCEQYGLDEQLSMKIACGFAGGLRSGEVCGVVSGAVMVIGLKYGQYKADDRLSKDKCYKSTSEFMEEYQKRNETVLCRELLGYDVRDIEARSKFLGRQKQICPKVIDIAANSALLHPFTGGAKHT